MNEPRPEPEESSFDQAWSTDSGERPPLPQAADSSEGSPLPEPPAGLPSADKTIVDDSLAVDRLGESLAAIDAVSSRDYRTVADKHQHKTTEILKDLESKGVITPFQRQRLLDGQADRLLLDEYVLLERIGLGGMGEVFKARNRSLDRIEAIKTMNAGYEPSSAVSQRFFREAKLLARIEHPAIVPIYKVGHAQGVDYIAMKFVEGINLQEKVDQTYAMGQTISIDQACEWISQAASALDKAHVAQVIHRDIKPSNLMVTPEGKLFLLDLGIARLSKRDGTTLVGLTNISTPIGTPEFMPPEQWADPTAVTSESDIYSLGCTLFFLLTGRPPFQADSVGDIMRGHTVGKIPPLAPLRPDAPKELEAIVRKMLAKNPEERFRRALDVCEALDRVPRDPEYSTQIRESPVLDLPPRRFAPREKTPGTRKSTLWYVSAALVSVLALAAGIGVSVWWNRHHSSPLTQSEQGPNKEVATSVEMDHSSPPPADTPPILEPPPVTPPSPPSKSWVAAYSLENALEWGDDAEIESFAAKANGGTVPDELTDTIKARLDEETKRKRETRVDTLMAELIASLPENERAAWPDRQELARFVAGIKSFDSISSLGDLQPIRPALEKESARLLHPFDELRLSEVGDEKAQSTTRAVITGVQQMLALHAGGARLDGFDVRVTNDEGQPLDRIKAVERTRWEYRATVPVHVVVVRWDDEGPTFLMLPKPLDASSSFKGFLSLRFEQPGEKGVAVYATDQPYFDVAASQLDVSPYPWAKAFATDRIVPRLRKAFELGEILQGSVGEPPNVRWDRKMVVLTVER